MSYPPDWHQLATEPLPADDAIHTRHDIAGDRLLAALRRAINTLEHSGHDELAEQLTRSFGKAFQSRP